MMASLSFARNIEAQLKQEFGQDLSHAPFFLRFSFLKQYGMDWKESSYSERKNFLTRYENGVAAELAQEKAEAKAESDKEKERQHEKDRIARKIKARLKAEAAEEKAEKDEYTERQKSFHQVVVGQQRELDQMVQSLQQEQGKN